MAGLLLAGAWCALGLGAQLAVVLARPRPRLHAPPAGSAGAGVRYAFTGALAPWAKESVRMNPGAYALGILLHLGVFAAFAGLAWPSRPLAIASLAGAAAGLGLLGRRLAEPGLRGLSNADDFLSNLLVTAFAALAGAPVLFPPSRGLLPFAAIALLVYIPLGKLRHCVFFFLSRAHLGAFFGRRGCFPPMDGRHA